MKQLVRLFTALSIPLLLTGCLLIPGKFDSHLKLMNDGAYSFTYNGQMQMAEGDGNPMSSQPPEMTPFDPDAQQCTNGINKKTGEITPLQETGWVDNEHSTYESRTCTSAELAEMKQRHQEDADFMASAGGEPNQGNSQQNAAMGSIFGGAVAGDDESLKKFAAQLSKYDGWNKVEYMGDNLFEVEYAVTGNFDQNFAFPTIPGATMQFPFVQIIRRSGGELEVLTPAMAGAGGLAGAMGPMPPGGTSKSKAQPIDGSFTIETNGEVLSNNTADGYTSKGTMKKLHWKVDEASSVKGGPAAIVKLTK